MTHAKSTPVRRAAVVTVSDGVARGVRDDASGRAVAVVLQKEGFEVASREVVPDDRDRIEALLRDLAGRGTPLVVTTGGTGLGPRDVTPEATRAVIDREAPGLAEEMRASGRGSTPFASLSRGIAGSIGSTLILNLPGSERGATESLGAVLPALPHALDLLAGRTIHGPDERGGRAHPRAGLEWGSGGSVETTLRDRVNAGDEVVLATAVKVLGEPPCRVGQKLLLGRGGPLAGTLGCAEFDDAAVLDTAPVLDARTPSTRTYMHDLGSIEVYLEPYVTGPRLVVLSATPVALHLMRWARDLGFDPVLVEPRSERVTADHRAAGRVVQSLDGADLTEDTSAVATDHDSPDLGQSVTGLLRSPVRFIGVMGSARHVGPQLQELKDRGFADRDLERVRTPVGIDIGARTAEEIALSILAGLVADRRGGAGGWLDRR